jgi:hypothetical protein
MPGKERWGDSEQSVEAVGDRKRPRDDSRDSETLNLNQTTQREAPLDDGPDKAVAG